MSSLKNWIREHIADWDPQPAPSHPAAPIAEALFPVGATVLGRGMTGTVIPLDEWPSQPPTRWSAGTLVLIRWSDGSHSAIPSTTTAVHVLSTKAAHR